MKKIILGALLAGLFANLSGAFAVVDTKIISERQVDIVFDEQVSANPSKDGILFFNVGQNYTSVNVDSVALDTTGKILTVLLGDDLQIGESYGVAISSLTSINGDLVSVGSDGLSNFVVDGFEGTTEIPLNAGNQEAPTTTATPTTQVTVNLPETTQTPSVNNTTTNTQTSAQTIENNSTAITNEVNKGTTDPITTTEAAKNATELPKTGPEVLILFVLAIMLGFAAMKFSKKPA